MLTIIPIPAFEDNYIWLLHDGRHAVAVDAGDAEPLLDYLDEHGLRLLAVLDTHHHQDHIAGNDDLLARFPALPIYGSRHIATVNRPVGGGDIVSFAELDLHLQVLDTPGHTADHLTYYGANSLFCGDALFTCGCGKLFEGTPAQAYASLQKFAVLADETQVCCAHEYTLENIRFARLVEPDNALLAEREIRDTQTRARNLPTLPATLALEKSTNPFLCCDDPSVAAAASRYAGHPLNSPVEVFAALRTWRNTF
ncbi:MAG: hydroxyacylglutathione hydrolase [Sulfuricella sp.]|nr:hydroxyacylglutathione hydrolase [Sulfuricella sp.]